jgi:hypothetical protein
MKMYSFCLLTSATLILAVSAPAQIVLSIDINERGNDPATNTLAGFSSFLINSNVSATAIQTNATTQVFGGITVTLSNTAPLGYDDRQRATPVDSGAFTEGLLLRDFIFSRDGSGNGGLDISIAGLVPNHNYRVVIWSFDTGSGRWTW